MYKILYFVTLSTLYIFSCEKDFSSINQSPQTLSDPSIYIGKIGTKRVYHNTVRIFKPYTNIPYVIIPDSLRGKITLSDSLINLGYVKIGEIEENLVHMYKSNYENLNLPHSYEEYKRLEGECNEYNLNDEIKNLQDGTIYEGSHHGIGGGVFYENTHHVEVVLHSSPNWQFIEKPLYVNSEWVREYREYRNDLGQIERFQTEAKVLGEEFLEIEAGAYYAYKIEIKYHWIDLSYETIARYEYYVPNIGLVLEEADNHLYTTVLNSSGGSTTVFRRIVVRKELKSYAIIIN